MSEPELKMDMASSDAVRRCVESYCANERHPNLPRFKIHGPLKYEDIWKLNAVNLPGCYVIYGENGAFRYVGMSLTNIGNRISSHFSDATQKSPFWAQGPKARFVDLIEVIKPWEAPSLEQYLIVHSSKFNACN